MGKQYKLLAFASLLLGALAVMVYLPYTFEGFGVNCFKWIKITTDLFKEDYFKMLIYIGTGLLGLVIVFNLISLFKRPNISKICFKLSTIVALILPLLFVMSLNIVEWKWAWEFWVENISTNIKTYAYIAMGVSAGLFIIGLVRNFTAENKATFHHIFKNLMMVALLAIMAYVYSWCGWTINANTIGKIYGLLMGWLAIYFPVSTIVLLLCAKFSNR